MQVDGCHIRYAPLDALREPCARNPRGWLSTREQRELALWSSEHRRISWLAGRWLAKQVVCRTVDAPLPEITILSRDADGRSDRPRVDVNGILFRRSLSISHSERGLLVGLADSHDLQVGVDLTRLAPPTPGFLTTWFTRGEQQALSGRPSHETVACWAVKEAVYKAVQHGQSFQPRKFEVFRCPRSVYQCRYEGKPLPDHNIAVETIDGHVAVVVTAARHIVGTTDLSENSSIRRPCDVRPVSPPNGVATELSPLI